MILTLTITDAFGQMMLVRADMVSGIAHKVGPGKGRGVLLMMGRVIMEMMEDPSNVVGQIRQHEVNLQTSDAMSMSVFDNMGKLTYARPSHIIAITPMPIEMRKQAAMKGTVATGTVLWTLGGHGILTRESQDTVVRKMAGRKTDLSEFTPRVAGPTSPVQGNGDDTTH